MKLFLIALAIASSACTGNSLSPLAPTQLPQPTFSVNPPLLASTRRASSSEAPLLPPSSARPTGALASRASRR
jgi:hypothetical protein